MLDKNDKQIDPIALAILSALASSVSESMDIQSLINTLALFCIALIVAMIRSH